jgi:hypothetical protein
MHSREPTTPAAPVTRDQPAPGSGADVVASESLEQPTGGREERTSEAAGERVIEAGLASFPASDPPSWWAGA